MPRCDVSRMELEPAARLDSEGMGHVGSSRTGLEDDDELLEEELEELDEEDDE